MEWTPEAIDKLRTLWAQTDPQLSTQAIARQISGATKCAVVSKAHRIGLPGRPSPIQRDNPPPPKPRRLGRATGCTLPPLASLAEF